MKLTRPLFVLSLLCLLVLAAPAAAQMCPCAVEPPAVASLMIEVLAEYPHDSGSFTQGLLLHEGTFYESAGQYGQSDVRQVEIETGAVLRKVELNTQFFAEGLTLVEDRLIQLTWRENVAIVWDVETLRVIGQYLYETEGWGICYDGTRLYMSDGSSSLFVRDPQTFRLLDMIHVTRDGEPVMRLNELECVGDHIYANIWQTDTIVRIQTETGYVDGVVDASDLLSPEVRAGLDAGAVLNGIAYNPETDTFYLTGKLWPALFEVRLVAAEST